VKWWCSSSQGVAWTWTRQAYAGVWLFIALIAIAYAVHLRRAHLQTRTDCTRAITFFAAGLLALWLALDWPLAPLGSGYLASLHMVRYLLIALVAPPLLLLGIPATSYAGLKDWPRAFALLRNVTRPSSHSSFSLW